MKTVLQKIASTRECSSATTSKHTHPALACVNVDYTGNNRFVYADIVKIRPMQIITD